MTAARYHVRPVAAALAGTVAVLCALLVALPVAWKLLGTVDFGYPVLYRLLEIDDHIARYGPENRYRHGFETTSDAERMRLFGGIVDAVNRGGEGLPALRYQPAGGEPVPLLRPPEVEHLELVARLVDALRRTGLTAAGVLALTVLIMRRRRLPLGRPALAGGGVAAAAAVGLATAAVFDANASGSGWFGRLHDLAFPSGHQWFFYYQDSLMTTLMKAPDLFGPMAALLAGVTVALFLPLVLLVATLVEHHD